MSKDNIKKLIHDTIQDYLEAKGYNFTESDIENLVDIYEDCQEWNEDIMTTGASIDEIYDWIRHTSEVERLCNKNVNNSFRSNLWQKAIRHDNRLTSSEFCVSISDPNGVFVQLDEINDMIKEGVLTVNYDKLEERLRKKLIMK